MFRCLLLISLLLPLGSAFAAPQRYVASEHESRWVAQGSSLRCELTHEIPDYGKAVFEQSAGGELQFSVQSYMKPHKVGLARLVSAAPSWKHDVRERDLGQVSYEVKIRPFKLPHIVSRRVLSELQQGMFPTLMYEDWADGRDEVQVALSPVNVGPALGEFFNCLAGVLPYSFDDVRFSSFNYRTGQVEFGSKEKSRLDEVASYLNADPSVTKITISSHTDSRGYRSVNKEVSRRRATAVRDYLVSKGVAAELFTIKAYGESRPRASNRTAKGRAKNRFVEVSLLK